MMGGDAVFMSGIGKTVDEKARERVDGRGAEDAGEAGAQRAARLSGLGKGLVGIVERAQQRRNPFVIGRAVERQRERARRAEEQFDAEPLFETLDALRNRRRGRADAPRRGAERSGFDRPDDGLQAGGMFGPPSPSIASGTKDVTSSNQTF